MAVGWLSVLKMVPWGEVIDNAPKVAQGARKLWSAVGKKPAVAEPGSVPPTPTLESLQAQQAALQAGLAELHQQMLDSSALIQSLAEQNTALIRRIEIQRLRLWWLAAALAVLAAALVWLGLRG